MEDLSTTIPRYFLLLKLAQPKKQKNPYRKGKCLVFRVPFTKPGYYAGVFYHTPDISWDDEDAVDELLFNAMWSRTAWKPEDGDYDEFFKE